MMRFTLFLLLILTLSCAKQEDTTVSPTKPLLVTNTGATPQSKSTPQAKTASSNANARPSLTATPSTVTANKTSNSGEKRTQETTASSVDDYYTNSKGVRVRRPVFSSTAPAGATARCRDGSYSFSQSRRGTCSHHGGVAEWL